VLSGTGSNLDNSGAANWDRFRDWWRGTKPTDVLSVVMALLSVAIAFWALYKANQVSQQQAEATAPVLAPGTPLKERGQEMTVWTDYAKVPKRADRLFLDPGAGRLIIPLSNGGSGIGMTIGRPVLVADCGREPSMLPPSAVAPPLGSYVLPSGASDQLGFLPPTGSLATHYVNSRLWYSFDYKLFGSTRHLKPQSVLLWYTDGAQRKLRWTCVTYVPLPDRYGSEWAPLAAQYGTRTMVPIQPRTQ